MYNTTINNIIEYLDHKNITANIAEVTDRQYLYLHFRYRLYSAEL